MEFIGESVGPDLTVREYVDDDGWTLLEIGAPEGTPMGDFLASFAGAEDEFRDWLLQTIEERLAETQDGDAVQVPDRGETDREQAQEDKPGPLAQHEAQRDVP